MEAANDTKWGHGHVADKLGMRFEREWDDEGDIALVYAITREEAMGTPYRLMGGGYA